jgi:hypothetical protein
VDPAGADELIVVDQTARRIRWPIDLLRFLIAVLGIVALAGVGLLARATAAGVEIDAVGAGRRLPHAVLSLLAVVAALALLLLPVALAIRQLSRRQFRQLAEAVVTALAAMLVVALANAALRTGMAAELYHAIAASGRTARATGPLDGYLAGLIAYTTIIGLTGPSPWRTGLWLAIVVYGVASLVESKTTVLSLLITLLLGRAIGVGVRYAIGSWSQRPTAAQIAAALASAGQALASIRRSRQEGTESRRYKATTRNGGKLDIRVFDRDQEAAGAPYRLYRWARLQGQARRGLPLSLERTAERQALLSYAADEAGVRTPRLRALTRVGADTIALAHDRPVGTTLAEFAASAAGPTPGTAEPGPEATPESDPSAAPESDLSAAPESDLSAAPESDQDALRPTGPADAQTADDQPSDAQPLDAQPTDDQLRRVWEAVLRLHAHRVAHRALTANNIMFADNGEVILLDPGTGDVAATDLRSAST